MIKMKIVTTSIASEEAGALLNDHLVFLAKALNQFLGSQVYGDISQLTVIIVAVDSAVAENGRFCKGRDKVGRFKHPVSGEQVKYISFALPFDPVDIESAPPGNLRQMVIDALIARLRNPALKIPKAFKYDALVSDLETRLEILKRVEISAVIAAEP